MPGEILVFRADGIRFDEIPLARVAEYMTEIAKLHGPECYLVEIKRSKIVYRVGAAVDDKTMDMFG
jgi:hypothetical protein